MTNVIHHGSPGSYKTYSIVQNVVIPALQAGRVVITNIRGLNDIEKIKSNLSISLPESASIWYIQPDDDGFKLMSTFFHWAPAGALIAMDEGQRIYPTRNRRFDDLDLKIDSIIHDQFDKPLINSETSQPILRPKTVENAFDQHRHFNWDIYISTPNISKIHKEIRHVVEWAYRHRNNSGLLPWLKNTWTEFRHDAENNGKSVSHYSGSPKRYKADPKIFNCYQSTATGVSKDSSENISIFRDSRLRFLFIVICLCLSYVFYSISSVLQRTKTETKTVDQVPVVTPVQSLEKDSDISVPVSGSVVRNEAAAPVVSNEPLKNAVIYYAGHINNQPIFTVRFSPSSSFITLTYDDMRHLGYSIKSISGSFVALSYSAKTIYAFTRPQSLPIANRGDAGEQNDSRLGNDLAIHASNAHKNDAFKQLEDNMQN